MNYVKDLLTLDETADYLGVTITKLKDIRKNNPDFPVFKMSKRHTRVKFEHLQNWIDKKTIEQIKERIKK